MDSPGEVKIKNGELEQLAEGQGDSQAYGAGVSGISLLPYKFVGNSHEYIRQTGIPAHP